MENSLRCRIQNEGYYKINREINIFRPFTFLLNELNDKEKLKWLDHFINFNMKEKEAINHAKMLKNWEKWKKLRKFYWNLKLKSL